MMTKKSAVDVEVELTRVLREVQQLRYELLQSRQEVYVLSSQVALFWHPARDNWQRTAAPATEDLETPTLQLATPPDANIGRVTIDQNNFIRTYDRRGIPIVRYCGPFRTIGTEVLARTGNMLWEQVVTPSDTTLPRIPKLPKVG